MVWLLKNWKWVLAVMACACLLGFWRLDRAAQYRKGEAAATARISAELAKAAKKQHEALREASEQYQTAKAERDQKEKVRYVEVQKIIEKPVYHGACFDSDGLRIINDAISER